MTMIKEKQIKVVSKTTEFLKKKINSPYDAYQYIKQFYHDDIEIYESCFILMLNRSGYIIAYSKISQGGIAGTVVDVKIITKYAIDTLASSVILCHNHPSGNLNASNEDIRITKSIEQALKYFEIELFDHLIITSEGFKSLRSDGII